MRALQANGLAGLVVSKKYGGLDQGLLGLARACEILGQECASTAICFGMHCVGASVIEAQVTEHQAETYLRPIAEGRHLTTLALSESGTGANFYLPQARLTPGDGDYILSGAKQFVTNGTHADSYVVSAARHGDDELIRLSCVILDRDQEGMDWGSSWRGFGMRGNDSRSLMLKDVKVPEQNLLGAEGDQIWYILNVVAPYFLIAMSGTYLGIATAALETARHHLLNREYSHNGKMLVHIPLLQHRFGSLWSRLEATRQLVYSAATRFDRNDPDAVVSLLSSKAEVADVAVNTVNEAMTLMGGIAYRDGVKMQRHLRDVRAVAVMAPTTDILRTWAGRLLLSQSIFED